EIPWGAPTCLRTTNTDLRRRLAALRLGRAGLGRVPDGLVADERRVEAAVDVRDAFGHDHLARRVELDALALLEEDLRGVAGLADAPLALRAVGEAHHQAA